MKLTDFEVYRELLQDQSGLVLSHDKSYLLESRLTPLCREWGFASLEALTQAVQGVPDPKLVNDIVEAMTTNETSFFRDTTPFDIFKDMMASYIKEARGKKKYLRIWCAAASSGQEPYSLAMVLKELQAEYKGWKFDILSTDISEKVIEQARVGKYSQFEVQRGMPITMLMKYFTQDGDQWQVNDDIRKMVQFEVFNLLKSMSQLGEFDIVFCRNVLIYFNTPTKTDVLERLAKQMPDDGLLFLGGAETVLGITDVFKPVPERRGLYAKDGSVHLSSTEESSVKALA